MLNSRFAVLDDSPDDQNLVAAILCNVGATVKKFGHANDLFRALRTESFDALIVDWNMPDITGVEAVERIRRDMLIDVPIILVTSRNEDHEIVAGLHAGADDFITKPASAGILIARLNAVLRRQSNQLITSGEENFGEYAFDVPNRAVTRHGQVIAITEREFKLALALFRNLGRAVSRDHLMQAVWGHAEGLESRTLDVHTSRVRAKLQLSPANGWRVGTVYGYGYRLEVVAMAAAEEDHS